MQACVHKPKPPDTSTAWKAEAEKLKAELSACTQDRELLMQDLSYARDALAHQIAEGKLLRL